MQKEKKIMPHSQKFGLKSKIRPKQYKIAALTPVINVVRFQACHTIWPTKKAKIGDSSSQSENSYKFSKKALAILTKISCNLILS